MTASWPKNLAVRPLTTADARRIAQWRYDGPWKVYDPRPEDGLMSDSPAYVAVAGGDGGPLVGFCCFGVEATVPGLPVDHDVLDVGVGMDPSLVGQGHGVRFATAVLDYCRNTMGAGRLRCVVQAWNERSIRLTRSLGFAEAGDHVCEQNGQQVVYKVLVTD